MIEIYREVIRLIEQGEKAALATVVGSKGSTPGKEGAKMLVRADGSFVGTIGGGCTEADVWAAAREVIVSDRPRRLSFKLSPREAEAGGLACGGVVEIFIEPVGCPTVCILGAGHIARAVAPMAVKVGFNVIVADDREQFAHRAHFPEPIRLLVSDFDSLFGKLAITENSYLVIVTRGHRYDQYALGEAIKTRASYIGLIGSRAKVSRIFRALEAEGADAAKLQAVKAPIGLDIGCRTPEEIAVSIVAQLIAHRRRFYIKETVPPPSPRPAPAEAAAVPSARPRPEATGGNGAAWPDAARAVPDPAAAEGAEGPAGILKCGP